MRSERIVIAATAAVLLAGLALSAQQPSGLAGTWSGEATLEGQDGPNTLTLVLEMKEGKIAGHMTDQYGAIDADIKDAVLEKDAFNFTVPVYLPDGGQGVINFRMKVSGDAMKGEIEVPEMAVKGTWEAAKQK